MLRCDATKPTNPQQFLNVVYAAMGMTKEATAIAVQGDSANDNNGHNNDELCNQTIPLYIFDTETTGVGPRDSIVEIGCVEMINGRLTGRNFHRLCKPHTKMHPAAERVHGLSEESLKDEPIVGDALKDFVKYLLVPPLAWRASLGCPHRLNDVATTSDASPPNPSEPPAEKLSISEVAAQMESLSITKAHKEMWRERAANGGRSGVEAVDEVEGAKKAPHRFRLSLAGHNVAFDIRMLTANAEHFDMLTTFNPTVDPHATLCTLGLFKKLYPGQPKNTLDACCDFFGINRNISAAERAIIGDYRLKADPSQHSALTDAYMCGLLLTRMIEMAEKHTSV